MIPVPLLIVVALSIIGGLALAAQFAHVIKVDQPLVRQSAAGRAFMRVRQNGRRERLAFVPARARSLI